MFLHVAIAELAQVDRKAAKGECHLIFHLPLDILLLLVLLVELLHFLVHERRSNIWVV